MDKVKEGDIIFLTQGYSMYPKGTKAKVIAVRDNVYLVLFSGKTQSEIVPKGFFKEV